MPKATTTVGIDGSPPVESRPSKNGWETAPERISRNGGRSIRPFKVRGLMAAIGLVNTRAITLNEIVADELAAAHPWEVVPWQQTLGRLIRCMEGLEEACAEVRHVCGELFESAPADHAVAQRAALTLLERDR